MMKDVRVSRWFFVSKTRGWRRRRSRGRGRSLFLKNAALRLGLGLGLGLGWTIILTLTLTPTLKISSILKKGWTPTPALARPRGLLTPNLSTFQWDYILETIAITYPNFLSRFSSCSRNISSYVLPKCKRISLNFRAFKSSRKIENTIMTQTNLSCDNGWCACGYVFCLKIKITKVCNHN